MSDELLSPDDLGRVLGDSLVEGCVRWQDVGLGLGVKKRKLDEIEADCRGKTVDCKREMFSDWLDNTETPTMDELHKVINEVNERDKREQWREVTSKNEEEAVKATKMLLDLLDEWQKTNQELYDNHKQRGKDLQEVKHWMEDTPKRKWKEEDMKEEYVRAMERAEKIREALDMARNYQSNYFVRQFLREKGYSDPSNVNDELIVGLLREDLLNIEIKRGRILKERFRQTLKHQRQLKNVNDEIESIQKKINERLDAYDKIKNNLDQIGAKQKRIEELNDQMRELTSQLKEFADIKRDCNQTESHLNEQLSDAIKELKSHILSLKEIARLMKSDEDRYTSLLNVTDRVRDREEFDIVVGDGREIGVEDGTEIWEGAATGAATGATTGAAAGAVLGTGIFPVVGTAVGGVFGGVTGAFTGAVSGAIAGAFRTTPRATIRQSRPQANAFQENNLTLKYKESIRNGSNLVRDLQNLLD